MSNPTFQNPTDDTVASSVVPADEFLVGVYRSAYNGALTGVLQGALTCLTVYAAYEVALFALQYFRARKGAGQ